jgi:hypothetical protein
MNQRQADALTYFQGDSIKDERIDPSQAVQPATVTVLVYK